MGDGSPREKAGSNFLIKLSHRGFYPPQAFFTDGHRFEAAMHLKRMEGATMSTQNMRKSDSHRNSHGRRKWSGAVTTDSTHPQSGLFNQGAKTIARELASKKVSPKGPSSGMRMLTFYINRAGKNLPASRLKVLEDAKKLLHERIAAAKDGEKAHGDRRVHRKSAA